jgi:hypothetical protein
MSYSEVLGVVPNQRPVVLATLRNAHGWAPSIWDRLLAHHGHETLWINNDAGLNALWQQIETLPEWQQAPLVLTFDTGVIPFQAYEWAAQQLDEFERRLPSNPDHVNHVPTVADLLRTNPEAPLIGVYGTSVSENPFDPWDEEKDDSGSGIPLSEMYVLERHRPIVAEMFS